MRTLFVAGTLVVVFSSGANVPDALRDCYPNPGETLLMAFGSFSGPRLLDLAPATDLLASSVRDATGTGSLGMVSWMVAGVKRSAEL